MCVHFFQLWSFENYTSNFIPHLSTKIRALSLPPLIFFYLQALIHGFLWWWASSWLIFSLKWLLQSSFFLLHYVVIDLQEAKDSIDEEDPRPTSFTWSYITYNEVSRSFAIRWKDELEPTWHLLHSSGNMNFVTYNQDLVSSALFVGWTKLREFYGLTRNH